MNPVRILAAASALLVAGPIAAQEAPSGPPDLIVAISVDQLSADLFAEYREQFEGGFARLSDGVVFPSGYQSHSATETCPGHSTILTGSRPARTGIIANDWIDLETQREDKTVYCAEDESVPGSTSSRYTVSPVHLRVPTLGAWMKAANPQSRVVVVGGKDRAVAMLGGDATDQAWWWNGSEFVTYAGRTAPETVTRLNTSVAARLAEAQPALPLPDYCRRYDRAVPIGNDRTVGTGRFARAAGDARAFRASPEFDEAVLALAAGLAAERALGKGEAPDLLAIGASATDYVGHSYGTHGTEMCLQLLALDQTLEKLFTVLDAQNIDYAVVLTADHGGHDLPERNTTHAMPMAERVRGLSVPTIGSAIAGELGLSGQLLWGGAGDVWIDPALSESDRIRVRDAAVARIAAHPQVEAVLTREQLLAGPAPDGPPETWSLVERARASYDPERSGDLIVALKPRVTPIPNPGPGYVATHGSFWDYDRRVPILFWRRGMTGFEQPLSVETVDIAPTLAALLGIDVPVEIDGRCLDLDGSDASSCR
ncbi:alkaline phosphatase family protein [Sphingosinithalassobacter sp. LHW66-3]|uniref:alkaline phosphatase family protein n=1 Tax=Sphingosinithalassobacter sp. LHW66-3 TaxID=3424718 RepID=UPI003D6BB793